MCVKIFKCFNSATVLAVLEMLNRLITTPPISQLQVKQHATWWCSASTLAWYPPAYHSMIMSTLATKQLSALYRYTVYSWWNDVNGTLKKLGGQLLGDLWTSPIVTYIKLTWASLSALYAPPPSPPLSISIIVAEKPIYISCYQEFTFLTADKSRLVDRFFSSI